MLWDVWTVFIQMNEYKMSEKLFSIMIAKEKKITYGNVMLMNRILTSFTDKKQYQNQ